MIHRAFILALGATSATLGGCAGFFPSNGAAAPNRVNDARPDASLAKQDLLYVANTNGEVTIYRYWLHTLVGVLTNFTQPMGECVDAKSNVYITDDAAKQVLEFAHGGTKPLKKFNDAPDSPYACSVDQKTGDLAVANNDGTQQGNIAIWTNGTGQPAHYNDSLLFNFAALAYDANGNLVTTSGGSYNVPPYFAWLPKGGTQLINITIPGPNPSWQWRFASGIQWDGKYFVIDDNYLIRIALIHGLAYYVGETDLYGGGYPIWIYDNKPGQQGTQAVGGYYSNSYSRVDYYHYPSGGSAYYELTHGVDRPTGLTVSLRTQ
jgi:hypothetical protein